MMIPRQDIQILQLLNNPKWNWLMKQIQRGRQSHCFVPLHTQIHGIVF
uniref:Uncharacterized protein n=1 Tax=Lutzomyia longipalpis TaxID=7200 RepID=A0A1B0GLF0_LUTLO